MDHFKIFQLSKTFGTEMAILKMIPSAAPAMSFCLRDLRNYIDGNGIYQFLKIKIESKSSCIFQMLNFIFKNFKKIHLPLFNVTQ